METPDSRSTDAKVENAPASGNGAAEAEVAVLPASGNDAAVATPSAPPAPPAEAPAEQKGFKFPTALTVLAIILGVVWVASFFIPSGIYQLHPTTRAPIPGTYTQLP